MRSEIKGLIGWSCWQILALYGQLDTRSALLNLKQQGKDCFISDFNKQWFRVATIPRNRESVITDYVQEMKKNLPIHESFFPYLLSYFQSHNQRTEKNPIFEPLLPLV